MNTRVLSGDQLDFFFREGYVIVKNVYTKDEIETTRRFFREKFETAFWEISDFNSPTIINDIYRHFPELAEIIFKPAYIAAVRDIFQSEIICIPECAVHHNRFFDWHRDTTTLEAGGERFHRTGPGFLVQCSTYFQDNGPGGGGLTVVPRSHHRPDRFLSMYYGSYLDRARHKLLKLLHRSTFHRIERNEHPVDVPTKAGDLLIFNNQLDHRATFLRGRNGKPVSLQQEKFAVFNTFGNQARLASLYLNSLKSSDEPYARFLKQTSAPSVLVRKADELKFSLCY